MVNNISPEMMGRIFRTWKGRVGTKCSLGIIEVAILITINAAPVRDSIPKPVTLRSFQGEAEPGIRFSPSL